MAKQGEKEKDEKEGKARRQARTGKVAENFTRKQEKRQRNLARRAAKRNVEATMRVKVKRDTRERLRGMQPAERAEASRKGQRQFGGGKGHHLHQREHGLARALTADEFRKQRERENASKRQPSGQIQIEHLTS